MAQSAASSTMKESFFLPMCSFSLFHSCSESVLYIRTGTAVYCYNCPNSDWKRIETWWHRSYCYREHSFDLYENYHTAHSTTSTNSWATVWLHWIGHSRQASWRPGLPRLSRWIFTKLRQKNLKMNSFQFKFVNLQRKLYFSLFTRSNDLYYNTWPSKSLSY